MIVLEKEGNLLAITQLEHQEIAGQLASYWGNSEFSRPEPSRAMIVAAGNHDIGWWNRDVHPTVNLRNNFLYTFTELPVLEWLQMYRKGIDQIAEIDPYEGLIVCMHGVGLRKNRYDTVPATDRKDSLSRKEKKSVHNYIAAGEKLQAKLRRKVAKNPLYKRYSSEKRIWANYRLIQVWDRLSLHFCSDGKLGGITDGVLKPVPMKYGNPDTALRVVRTASGTFSVTPFPFKGPIRLFLRARKIVMREYLTDEDLRREYYNAEIVNLPIEISEAS